MGDRTLRKSRITIFIILILGGLVQCSYLPPDDVEEPRNNYLYDKLAGQWIRVKARVYGAWTDSWTVSTPLEYDIIETAIFDTDSTFRWLSCKTDDYIGPYDSSFVTYDYKIYRGDNHRGGQADYISSGKLFGEISIYDDSMEIFFFAMDARSTQYFIKVPLGWMAKEPQQEWP